MATKPSAERRPRSGPGRRRHTEPPERAGTTRIAGPAGFRLPVKLVLAGMTVGGRLASVLQPALAGVLITELALTAVLRTSLVVALSSGFAGYSLGLAYWFRRGEVMPSRSVVLRWHAAAALGLLGILSAWWLPPAVAVVAVGLCVFTTGATLSVGRAVRQITMRASRDRAADAFTIERMALPAGGILSLALAVLGQRVNAHLVPVVAAGVALTVGLAYWSTRRRRDAGPVAKRWPEPPPERATERATVAELLRRPGTIQLLGMGAVAFSVPALVYSIATLQLQGLPVQGIGHIGAEMLTTVVVGAQVTASVLTIRWKRHLREGVLSVIWPGGCVLMVGLGLVTAAGATAGWPRVVVVLVALVATEGGLSPLNIATQDLLQSRAHGVQSNLLFYIVRGITASVVPSMLLLPPPLMMSAVTVVLAAGAVFAGLVLGGRRAAKHRLKGAVGDGIDTVVIRDDDPDQPLVVAWRLRGGGEWLASRVAYGDRLDVERGKTWFDPVGGRETVDRVLSVRLAHAIVRGRRLRPSQAQDPGSQLLDGLGIRAGRIVRGSGFPRVEVAMIAGVEELDRLDPALGALLAAGPRVRLDAGLRAAHYRFEAEPAMLPPETRLTVRVHRHRLRDMRTGEPVRGPEPASAGSSAALDSLVAAADNVRTVIRRPDGSAPPDAVAALRSVKGRLSQASRLQRQVAGQIDAARADLRLAYRLAARELKARVREVVDDRPWALHIVRVSVRIGERLEVGLQLRGEWLSSDYVRNCVRRVIERDLDDGRGLRPAVTIEAVA